MHAILLNLFFLSLFTVD